MTFKIKHIPNGITPYEDDAYERKPYYPTEEDIIIIKCVVTKCDENAEIKLHLKVNKTEKIFHPKKKMDLNKREMNCEFEIGKFKSEDKLSYYFEGESQHQKIKTKEYQFAIHKWINNLQIDKVEFKNNCMIGYFNHEKKMTMLFYYKNGMLKKIICENKHTEKYFGDECTYEQVEENVYQYKNNKSHYYIEFKKDPFEISIKNELNNTLLYLNMKNIKVRMDNVNNISSIECLYKTISKEFYGFGERYDALNQKGKTPYMFVIEEFANQEEKTYIPIPFFMTEQNFGIFINSTLHTHFDLCKVNESIMSIRCDTNPKDVCVDYHMIFGTPVEMLKQYYNLTGYPKLPPKWAFGPWMSSNGWNTQEETLRQVEYMKHYDIPATVLVLEAWSDEITFYTFNDAKYKAVEGSGKLSFPDYRFTDEGKWENPKEMVDALHNNNLKLILWQIPVIKYEEGNENKQHKLDEEYVINNKLCLFNDDGTPYRITDNWFANSLVIDFTNPKASKWWFEKRQYLTQELGVDGFKTDGGEFVYDDTCLFHNGKTGFEMRNQYPIAYIDAYTNFIGKDKVLFSRAGYIGAGNYPLHWAGDKLSTFEEFKSTIIAGLSANISGIPFWGFDIGGFSGELPSTELYIRSAQVAAFSPIMQFHSEPRYSQENNDRTPWNIAEHNGDEIVITLYGKYANIRMNILPYVYNEALKVAKKGVAMMRPLFYDFYNDKKTYNIETEYMFGENLLICPVIEEDAQECVIYLPEGEWSDLFTGGKYTGNTYINYQCPLEKIPVFIKDNSIIAMNLNQQFELGGRIGNTIDSYEELCFLINGDCIDEYTFSDDIGNNIKIQIDKADVYVENQSEFEDINFIISRKKEPKNMKYIKDFNEYYKVWKRK